MIIVGVVTAGPSLWRSGCPGESVRPPRFRVPVSTVSVESWCRHTTLLSVLSGPCQHSRNINTEMTHSHLLTTLVMVRAVMTYQTDYRTVSVSPVITTEARTHRAPVSDEVILQCNPQHLGKFVVVWKHGTNVLTAGNMMVSPDSRYSLSGGYNLRINNLRPGDEGTYTCSITTYGDPVTLSRTLEILGNVPTLEWGMNLIFSPGIIRYKNTRERGENIPIYLFLARMSGRPPSVCRSPTIHLLSLV